MLTTTLVSKVYLHFTGIELDANCGMKVSFPHKLTLTPLSVLIQPNTEQYDTAPITQSSLY